MNKVILIIIILFSVTKVYASNNNLGKAIQEEIKKTDPNLNIGIKIRNLTNGKILYEQNDGRYYNFASGLKLISLTALSQYFGADYHFANKILQKGNDYYLDINDPDFSTNDLDLLIKNIKSKRVKNINNFYIINTSFSLPAIMENNMIVDSLYCYGAPTTKVHINKNCVKSLVRAGKKIKDRIYIQPNELIPYKIVNKATTVSSNYGDRIITSIKGDVLTIDGTLNISKQELVPIIVVAADNLLHIKLILKKLLDKHNISIKGKILYSSKPEGAKEIASNYKDFYQLAITAMKNSDNNISNYLLAELCDIYGIDNWRRAGELLKQLVHERFNVDLTDSVIVDGSGLSRYNMLTVNQFDHFLTNFYQKDKDLIIKLAEQRLTRRFEQEKIVAKTGTMTGISSLVGYVFDKNDNIYSFVIVSNNYFGVKKKYAELEDNVIKLILK